MAGRFFNNFLTAAATGHVVVGTNTVKAGLHLSTFTPDYTANKVWADISATEATGTNYPAGGLSCTAVGGAGQPSIPTIPANSYSVSWSAGLAVGAGMAVRTIAGNGNIYTAIGSGTTGGAEPSWNTGYLSVTTDNGISWVNRGTAMTYLSLGVPSATLTIANFRYVSFRDSGTGYLIALHDLGSTQTFASPTLWTFTPDVSGAGRHFWQ